VTEPQSDRPRLARILQPLIERTKERKVVWTVGPGDSYLAQFSSGTIVVRSVDEDGQHPFGVEALDDNGRVVASDFTARNPSSQDERAWGNLVAVLYSNGRAAALNIDEKLDALLEDIERGRQPEDDIPF